MSIIDETTPAPRHPNVVSPLPVPAWATTCELNVDLDRSVRVLSEWAAPQSGEITCGGSEVLPFGASLCQDDVIDQGADLTAIGYEHGEPFIFLTPLDARFTTTAAARAFAAAIVACCDRLDDAG